MRQWPSAIFAPKETLAAYWDLQDEETGDNFIAQALDAVLTWAMWHEHILSALRRLGVFRAERYVNVARAASVLDTEAYSASKTVYVNDKLNLSWPTIERITQLTMHRFNDEGVRERILLCEKPPLPRKGTNGFTRDFLKRLGILKRRLIHAPRVLKDHHRVETVRLEMRKLTGEMQLGFGALDCAAFDVRKLAGLAWAQLVADRNVRRDLGDDVPTIQLLSDAMRLDSVNMISRTMVRPTDTEQFHNHPRNGRVVAEWLADDKYSSMKEVSELGGDGSIQKVLRDGAHFTTGVHVVLPSWVTEDGSDDGKARAAALVAALSIRVKVYMDVSMPDATIKRFRVRSGGDMAQLHARNGLRSPVWKGKDREGVTARSLLTRSARAEEPADPTAEQEPLLVRTWVLGCVLAHVDPRPLCPDLAKLKLKPFVCPGCLKTVTPALRSSDKAELAKLSATKQDEWHSTFSSDHWGACHGCEPCDPLDSDDFAPSLLHTLTNGTSNVSSVTLLGADATTKMREEYGKILAEYKHPWKVPVKNKTRPAKLVGNEARGLLHEQGLVKELLGKRYGVPASGVAGLDAATASDAVRGDYEPRRRAAASSSHAPSLGSGQRVSDADVARFHEAPSGAGSSGEAAGGSSSGDAAGLADDAVVGDQFRTRLRQRTELTDCVDGNRVTGTLSTAVKCWATLIDYMNALHAKVVGEDRPGSAGRVAYAKKIGETGRAWAAAMARHYPPSALWQYVSAAKKDMERLAGEHGQLDKLDDSILELENKDVKALNVFTGGKNVREEQEQMHYVSVGEGEFREAKRRRHNVVGRSAQKLRKGNDAKELSKLEPRRLTRSDKRRRTGERKSEEKVRSGAVVRAELEEMDTERAREENPAPRPRARQRR